MVSYENNKIVNFVEEHFEQIKLAIDKNYEQISLI